LYTITSLLESSIQAFSEKSSKSQLDENISKSQKSHAVTLDLENFAEFVSTSNGR